MTSPIEKLAQTYVQHNGKWFFVSTINRESSALAAYGMMYAETMVWEVDYDTKKRGELLYSLEAGKDSLREHQRAIEELFMEGKIEE
jgi:hypothetical protein